MPGSADPRWIELQKIAKFAYLDAIDTIACLEVLGAGNKEPLIRRINQAGAELACELIYKALVARVLLNTIRAYDPIRKGDFHLAVAFKLLEDTNVVAIARDHGSHWHIMEAVNLWQLTAFDDRIVKLRHYRNKVLAHLSDLDANVRLPIYNDLFEIARRTSETAEKLSIGASTCTVELRHQTNVYRESSERFWSIWLRN
jgi:hypothetical protein